MSKKPIGGNQRASLKARVLARHGARCWICKRAIAMSLPSDHPDSWSIDHVIPRRDGGTHAIRNLRPAHRACNEERDGNYSRRTGKGGTWW